MLKKEIDRMECPYTSIHAVSMESSRLIPKVSTRHHNDQPGDGMRVPPPLYPPLPPPPPSRCLGPATHFPPRQLHAFVNLCY